MRGEKSRRSGLLADLVGTEREVATRFLAFKSANPTRLVFKRSREERRERGRSWLGPDFIRRFFSLPFFPFFQWQGVNERQAGRQALSLSVFDALASWPTRHHNYVVHARVSHTAWSGCQVHSQLLSAQLFHSCWFPPSPKRSLA